jgi:hypothetical protein
VSGHGFGGGSGLVGVDAEYVHRCDPTSLTTYVLFFNYLSPFSVTVGG